MDRRTGIIVAIVAVIIVVIAAYFIFWPEDAPIEAEDPAAVEEPAEPEAAEDD